MERGRACPHLELSNSLGCVRVAFRGIRQQNLRVLIQECSVAGVLSSCRCDQMMRVLIKSPTKGSIKVTHQGDQALRVLFNTIR